MPRKTTTKTTNIKASTVANDDFDGDEFTIAFHPDSLVQIVEDLTEQGLSEKEIAEEVEKMKKLILEQYKTGLKDGTISDDVYTDDEIRGCGDPTCQNCGGVGDLDDNITFH